MPLRAPRILVAVALFAVAPAAHAGEDPWPPPRTDVAHAGFAFSGEYGVTNGARAQLSRGLTMRALLVGTHRGSLAVVLGMSEGLADYRTDVHHIQEHSTTGLRSGLSVSWGAPFRPWRWGIALDVGFESIVTRHGAASASPYGGVEVRVGLCRCTAFRPFLAGTGRAVLDQFGEHVETATAGLGLAWALQ